MGNELGLNEIKLFSKRGQRCWGCLALLATLHVLGGGIASTGTARTWPDSGRRIICQVGTLDRTC